MSSLNNQVRSRLRGLYIITDTELCADQGLYACVRRALEGGARLVQYRDKSADRNRRLREAEALRTLCDQYNATFIVNDDVALALAVGAHGVHLGRDDAGIATAREMLGAGAIIGMSCYDSFEDAVRAEAAGADYVAFGSVFPSKMKPAAVRAPLDLFERAQQELTIPSCAIGGIDSGNIGAVIDSGADMAAVISAVFGQVSIQGAARELCRAFSG